ncbi:exodeoxyribonuclease VII small subunit [Thermaerobacter composti]|uniref:Exodeoxyribonuclease 7 small subunit n=1 Tax=Thermaerobacter composti TaxID=554949 RepID=A0ABZ0QTT3_9FIRM|nr:exodeoxyribonuclease VII small subunit [Thermaerobacter composti]WPD20137.1 exodeoxyribonuclease VII small subunit [Thermaerobacter composti]
MVPEEPRGLEEEAAPAAPRSAARSEDEPAGPRARPGGAAGDGGAAGSFPPDGGAGSSPSGDGGRDEGVSRPAVGGGDAAGVAPDGAPRRGAAMAPEPSFEAMLAELEAVVRQLESEEADLDRALALFQRGIELVRRCHRRLEAMERQVQWLLEDATGAVRLVPAPELDPAAEGGDNR